MFSKKYHSISNQILIVWSKWTFMKSQATRTRPRTRTGLVLGLGLGLGLELGRGRGQGCGQWQWQGHKWGLGWFLMEISSVLSSFSSICRPHSACLNIHPGQVWNEGEEESWGVSPDVLLPDCLTAWFPDCHCLTASLPNCLTAWLPHCLTSLLPDCQPFHCLTAWLHDCLTASLPSCLTAWPPSELSTLE